MYDAVVMSKLVYGLETLQLTRAEQRRLDAFQMRGVRKILRIPSTYEIGSGQMRG